MLTKLKKGMGVIMLVLISLVLLSGAMSGCKEDDKDRNGLGLLLLLGVLGRGTDSCSPTSSSGFVVVLPCSVAQ